MSTLVANDDMVLAASDPTVVCTITPIGPASTKVKAVSKGVVQDGYSISVSAITVPSAGATIPDPGPYVVGLNASATKVKAESKLVCLQGDSSDSITATPQIPGTPPTPYPVTFTIDITSAGQTKVKAA